MGVVPDRYSLRYCDKGKIGNVKVRTWSKKKKKRRSRDKKTFVYADITLWASSYKLALSRDL